MKNILLILVFILSFFSSYSQTEFASIIRDGDKAMKNGNYLDALKKYDAAEAFDPSQKILVSKKRDTLFTMISSVRSFTANSKKQIKRLLDTVQFQKEMIQEQKIIVDSALAKAERFINALSFYADKYAMAYKNGKVGYINKKGEVEIPYRYETAGAFDYTGFAKVNDIQEFPVPNSLGIKTEFRPVAYLIDTNDVQYKVVYNLDDLIKKEQIIEDEKIIAVDLRNNPLLNFPPIFKDHPELQVLILDGSEGKENNLKSITTELSFFTKLKYLFLQYCKLDSLPSNINLIDSLQSLSIRKNSIKFLPAGITQLKELQYLNLKENELNELPDDIGNLKKLKSLLLTDNRISKLPAGISGLSSLQVLDIRKNDLPVWPNGLEKLSSLRQLNYSENGLRDFPIELTKLKNLEVLDLSFNLLTILPQQINLLTALKNLSLKANNLTGLDNSFQDLKNLQWLDLSGNNLKRFPSQVLKLEKLSFLDLSFNKEIKSIPEEIKDLKNLRTLILNNTNIPESDRVKIKNYLPWCNVKFIQESH